MAFIALKKWLLRKRSDRLRNWSSDIQKKREEIDNVSKKFILFLANDVCLMK